MSEFTDTLTKKAGPLPVWAWGALAGGGIVVFRFIRARSDAEVETDTELAEDAPAPEYYAPYSPDLLTRRPSGGNVDIPYYNPVETVAPEYPTVEEIAEEVIARIPVPETPPERNPLEDFVNFYSVLFPLFNPTPAPVTTPAAVVPADPVPAPVIPAADPIRPAAPAGGGGTAQPRPTAPAVPSRTPTCGHSKGDIVWSGKNEPNMATVRAQNPRCNLEKRKRGGNAGWVVVVI